LIQGIPFRAEAKNDAVPDELLLSNTVSVTELQNQPQKKWRLWRWRPKATAS
jgi:hypothetical protein